MSIRNSTSEKEYRILIEMNIKISGKNIYPREEDDTSVDLTNFLNKLEIQLKSEYKWISEITRVLDLGGSQKIHDVPLAVEYSHFSESYYGELLTDDQSHRGISFDIYSNKPKNSQWQKFYFCHKEEDISIHSNIFKYRIISIGNKIYDEEDNFVNTCIN